MCGIAGIIDQHGRLPSPEAVLRAMARSLVHRGPDDEGIFWDPGSRVGLAHRRLAILDTSTGGHQPMESASGRYVVAYNGEIYNYRELREELAGQGCRFRGASDTEVLLAAVETWGLRTALERFNGMFAIALWDRREHRLHLVRDRLGIKPLYYGRAGDVFLFASELKPLHHVPSFAARIDRGALSLYLRHNTVPAPWCIFEGMAKLPPGTVLTVIPGEEDTSPEPVPFWSAAAAVEKALARPFRGDDREAVDALDRHLRRAVRRRMVADVPLGAFLSGGIDSSTVVALMQAQSDRPVRTFSIGFWEKEHDEAPFARSVADHLGTDHTELYVTPEQALEVIPRLPAMFDEPFADSSQVPTYLVSELARRHVTVALSGDGGDELFCGYERYAWGAQVLRPVSRLPRALRPLLGRVLAALPPAWWNVLLAPLRVVARGGYGRLLQGDALHKFAAMVSCGSREEMYRRLVSHWKEEDGILPGVMEPLTVHTDPTRRPDLPTFEQYMMFVDLVSYLPDDILTKVDRASMSVSLEARVPLLDHEVVEFAWSLPLSLKVRRGTRKWILRQVLQRYVPASLLDRPKSGFSIPLDAWLRGPLRDWAEDLLSERRLREEGFFDPAPIRRKWREHLSGRRRWHYFLWDVLMFEAWLEETRRQRG